MSKILEKLGKATIKGAKALYNEATKPEEVTPYKCRICGKWKKYASKAKGICRQCYKAIEEQP